MVHVSRLSEEIRYDTRCYFNVRSKADMIRLNIPHAEKSRLKEHVQRHGVVKPYVCSECPKRFCTTGELRQHHSEYKQFICGLCDKMFEQDASWKKLGEVFFMVANYKDYSCARNLVS